MRSEEMSSDGLSGTGPPARSVNLSTVGLDQERRQRRPLGQVVAEPGDIAETEPPVQLRAPQVGIDQQHVLVDVQGDADGQIGRR